MWNVKAWRPAQPGDAAWDSQLWRGEEVAQWVVPGTQVDPSFTPDYGAAEMARKGVFGRAYFGGPAGRERLALLPAGHPIHNETWQYTNIRGRQCAKVNRFGKPASLHREWWLQRGLIATYDPLGWYEWYIWYELGRRLPAYDSWQIDRWRRFRARHTRMYAVIPQPGQAQALLHWGVDAGRAFHAAATGRG